MRIVTILLLILSSFWADAQEPTLVLPFDIPDYISSIEFSKNNSKILINATGETSIWDVKTGLALKTFKTTQSSSVYGEFRADSQIAITYDSERKLLALNIYTGEELTLDYGKKFSKFLFSPDLKRGIAMLNGNYVDIFLFKIENGELIKRLTGHNDGIIEIKLSRSSNKIISTSLDSSIKIWDACTGELIQNFSTDGDPWLSEIKGFSSDESIIVLKSEEKGFKVNYRIYDIKTGRLIKQIVGEYGGVLSLNGNRLAVHTGNGKIEIIETISGNIVSQFYASSKYITSMCLNQNGSKVVTSSFDKEVKIWSDSGHLLTTLTGYKEYIAFSSFSYNDGYLATVSGDHNLKIWNMRENTITADIKGHINEDKISMYYNNENIVTLCNNSKSIKFWNTHLQKLTKRISENLDGISNFQISPNKSWLITASENYKHCMIWDLKNDSITKVFPENESFYYFSISEDSKLVATITKSSYYINIYKIESGELVKRIFTNEKESNIKFIKNKFILTNTDFSTKKYKLWNIDSEECLLFMNFRSAWTRNELSTKNITPDGIFLVLKTDSDTIKIVNINSQNTLSISQNEIECWDFSQDGKIIVGGRDGVKVYSSFNGKFLYEFSNQKNAFVYFTKIFPDKNRVIVASMDDTIKVWNLKPVYLQSKFFINARFRVKDVNFTDNEIMATRSGEYAFYDLRSGKLKYSLIDLDSTDYLYKNAQGYYLSTLNASKLLHYVTKNLKAISFDQLDIKYNRPDKVLETLGNTDTALINSYRKAYEKRIKKLGIDTTSFREGYSTPEADFANRDAIDYEQHLQQVKLHISGKDSTYPLDRFNVWVNESPLYGLRGISLKNRHTHLFDTTITIPLSDGRNQVETSVTDANGTESYRIPLYVNYIPPKPDSGRLHFVGIGINRFADNQNNLSWSVKDVRDLANSFKARYGSTCTIDTLFDEAVTTAKVSALKKKLLQTGVNDKVIVAYSGHGLLSKDYDYYLSTYNINFSKPEDRGLPYDVLENLLDSIPARKKLMLIDACHSGEVDKEEMQQYKKVQQQLDPTKKGVYLLVNKDAKRLGTKNSFELMQDLFVNVGRSTGATIISAASGTQFALERNNLQNGVFTYSILEYMKAHLHTSVSELKKWVNQRVPELTQGAQVPTARSETNSADWQVW